MFYNIMMAIRHPLHEFALADISSESYTLWTKD